MQRWKQFEYYSCIIHNSIHGGHVWHWSHVPEYVLVESGYVSSTEELRIIRKRHKGRIPEFGLDGIALHEDGVYHGIQAKLWRSILSAGSLGTFFSVIFGRMRKKNKLSTGFLYYTGHLQHELQYDMLQMTNIIARHISYPICGASCKTSMSFEALATSALKRRWPWTGAVHMHVPCSVTIAGVLNSFFQSIQSLQVVTIASHTYYASQVLISEISSVKCLAATHNTPSYNTQLQVINNAHLASDHTHSGLVLLISCEPLGEETVFTYSMRDAIDNGDICDYYLNLPVCETVMIPYDEGVHHANQKLSYDPMSLSMFLSSGMLETGCFRCIIHCADDNECQGVVDAFTCLCTTYHNTRPYAAAIGSTKNMTNEEWNKVIAGFESSSNHLAVIAVVDIDVTVECADSSCLTPTTAVRNNCIHKLFISNHKSKDRPSKVANAFIFSNDTDTCHDMIASVHSTDQKCLSRIRLISANYDTKTEEESVALREQQLPLVIDAIQARI